MKLVSIVGARPQFIKASPLSLALRRRHCEVLVHTGQHYDYAMSRVFFEELGIPAPDHHLGVGSGPHGAQTGAMLTALEPVLQKETPEAVIVFGDTNSTLAGALAAVKLGIPIAHVEAGLRSFNRTMPEEINRVVTDRVSTWLFAPSESAAAHLAREGICSGVHVVGDIMVDALRMYRARAEEGSRVLQKLSLGPGRYYLATVHRAENADDPENLRRIFEGLGRLDLPVVVPLHPRTAKRVAEDGLRPARNVWVIEPQGYLDMVVLQGSAACILTDSGGMQKEAYYLGVPCVTMRNETEWVETIAAGWNTLVGTDPGHIVAAVRSRISPDAPRPDLYGDGRTAERIVELVSGGAA